MPTQTEIKDKMKKDAELERSGDAPKPKTIRQLLEDPKMQLEIQKALPNAVTPQRFTRLALTAVNSDPLLLQADSRTLLAACMQCAQLGLEPNTKIGQAWLLPFRNSRKGTIEVQFILGYRGIVDLAHRSEHIMSIEARSVYSNDDFDYAYGLEDHLHHKPPLTDRGEVIAFYAITRFKSGGHYWVVLSKEVVEEHRARSSSPNSPAWTNDYDAMGCKTCVRVSAPYLPLSPIVADAIAADESTPQWEQFSGENDFIDVPSAEGDENRPDDAGCCGECAEVDGGHRTDCSLAQL